MRTVVAAASAVVGGGGNGGDGGSAWHKPQTAMQLGMRSELSVFGVFLVGQCFLAGVL